MAELDDPRRLAEFRASILSVDPDHVLQKYVERAAEQAKAPIALVSFVMKKIQLFRAAVGLPEELEATRAASRSQSFCQFVVKTEGPFLVTDAKRDERVPQGMVETYGIAAYAGVPIRVGGQVLGALCVADSVPREWSAPLVGELYGLARLVSERLEALTALDPSAEEVTRVPPRTLAARASSLAQVVQRSLVEVGPMVRLAQGASSGISPDGLKRAAKVLSGASDFYDEVMDAVAELCIATKGVEQSVATMDSQHVRTD